MNSHDTAIEFRVKNFRSFKYEQVFSLVASKDKTFQEFNTMPSGIKAAPQLVRSAVIYGPNAAGKSNLLKALQNMRAVLLSSPLLRCILEQLDDISNTLPSEFEVTFILEGVRYQYGFALTSQRIVDEYFLAYKAFKPKQWFHRFYDSAAGKDSYEFGSGLKGQKRVWEGATRPNSLFLSMAVQLYSEQLRPIYEWFAHMLAIINDITPLNPQYSVEMLQKAEGKQAIRNFLNAADISIADIEVVPRKVPALRFELPPAARFELVGGKAEAREHEMEINELRFHHVTESGEAEFGLDDESAGTRNLLFLIDGIGSGLSRKVPSSHRRCILC